jgi:hypothetical protein
MVKGLMKKAIIIMAKGIMTRNDHRKIEHQNYQFKAA